ncbi:MAG: hypothetical protein JNL90_18660 [Planctomycetes bacterium]|nr:hypothetical protein [Planctomycetota bacterium]
MALDPIESRRWQRVALAIVLPALLLLLAAGSYALLTGRAPQTLLRRPLAVAREGAARDAAVRDSSVRDSAVRDGGPRDAASGAVSRDPFQAHPDPRVGYQMRPSQALWMHGAVVESDALGLRRRTGPPPAAGARTIVLLGDSVAFGQGLVNEACPGQQLEDALAQACGASAAPRGVVRTVALPGWNGRNAFACLRDHWEALAPAVVVWLPIDNDLSDTEGFAARGRRRVVPDVESDDPWLPVSNNRIQERLLRLAARVEAGELSIGEADVGPIVLTADLGGESSRRYDALAEEVVALADDLDALDCRFAIAHYGDSPLHAALLSRVLARRPQQAVIPLIEELAPGDLLPGDPHPAAPLAAQLARWIATDLLTVQRWIDGAGELPADDPRFADRRAPRRTVAQWEERACRARAAAVAALCPAIVPAEGLGMNQVVGGLLPSGALGPVFLAQLPRRAGAAAIDLALAPLPPRHGLRGLVVEVAIDGVPAGTLALGEAPLRHRFALPAAGATPVGRLPIVEVRLAASRFTAIREGEAFDLAAGYLESLAIDDG